MKKKDFQKFIDSLDKKTIESNNKKEIEKSVGEYEKFKENFKQETCYICGKSLYNFSKNEVCLHNLLRLNNNFKKKHFSEIYKKWGYFQIQSYLRWCANYGNQGHINDLVSEKGKNKKFEITITWKKLEWTFSCSHEDFKGHKESKNSEYPHYHFQMRKDKQIFVKFRDFHIPFSEEDLFNFNMIESPKCKHSWNYGTGIQDKLNLIEEFPDEVMSSMKYSDSDEGDIKMGTLITGNINGNEIAEVMEESKKSGKTMAYLLQEKYRNNSDINIQTIVSPNDNIPDIATREGGRGKS